MSKLVLRKASRGAIFGRVCFFAEAGGGKTYSALATGLHLCEINGWDPAEALGVIDTELVQSPDRNDQGTGSAEKYEGRPCNCNRCHRQGPTFEFQTMLLPPGYRHPEAWMEAMIICARSGVKVLILDGITDEWRALLELVKTLEAKDRKSDPWATARPLHNRFLQHIQDYPGHIIATIRGKKETRHRKADDGPANIFPDQDSNILHDFDIGIFFKAGVGHVVKTRDDRLHGVYFQNPGRDLAEAIDTWCRDPNAQKKRAAEQRPSAGPVPGPKDGASEIMAAIRGVQAKASEDLSKRIDSFIDQAKDLEQLTKLSAWSIRELEKEQKEADALPWDETGTETKKEPAEEPAGTKQAEGFAPPE